VHAFYLTLAPLRRCLGSLEPAEFAGVTFLAYEQDKGAQKTLRLCDLCERQKALLDTVFNLPLKGLTTNNGRHNGQRT
jgi:hypothetical protein